MFHIGDLQVDSPVLLAPMAGVTDMPLRRLCRRYGAGLTTSEMITSDTRLWQSRKSSSRLVVEPQSHPVSMQIAGSDPEQLAVAAQQCVDLGAQIVDINMGCPAKKVCKKLAGSALLSDEALVKEILTATVSAVDVPVTLKTRTGPSPEQRNILRIAEIAEDAGIRALTVHGRTRACRFNGEAEYRHIAAVAKQCTIPVIANGDIDSAEKAARVLEQTGAAAVMIGRAALGAPWLFREIKGYLAHGSAPGEPSLEEKREVVLTHLADLHAFYGETQGVRIARKHFGWYVEALADGKAARKRFNQLDTAESQLRCVNDYFLWLKMNEEKAA